MAARLRHPGASRRITEARGNEAICLPCLHACSLILAGSRRRRLLGPLPSAAHHSSAWLLQFVEIGFGYHAIFHPVPILLLTVCAECSSRPRGGGSCLSVTGCLRASAPRRKVMPLFVECFCFSFPFLVVFHRSSSLALCSVYPMNLFTILFPSRPAEESKPKRNAWSS